MDLLFPQNPTMRKLPEPMFEAEFDAATSLGFKCLLFDEGALCAGEIDLALKRLPPGDGSELLCRGWILTEELYRQFRDALSIRGYSLISSAAQYAEVTYFPNYYPKVRDFSPAAVWTDTPDTFLAWTLARKLGDGPSSSRTTSSLQNTFGTKPALSRKVLAGKTSRELPRT